MFCTIYIVGVNASGKGGQMTKEQRKDLEVFMAMRKECSLYCALLH